MADRTEPTARPTWERIRWILRHAPADHPTQVKIQTALTRHETRLKLIAAENPAPSELLARVRESQTRLLLTLAGIVKQ